MNHYYYQWRKAKNWMISGFCFACALMVILPLGLVVFHLIRMGASSIDWAFLTQLPNPAGEPGGGMANAIVGSLILISLAAMIGIPVGVLGGVYLSEYASDRMRRSVRFAADLLNGTPSIVWGIVVYALVVTPMKGASAYAGGLALGFIIIPLVIRTTEEILHLVPNGHREAALALGIPKWKGIVFIVLKTAGRGIVSGALLACSRVAGETAPLLFTASGNQRWSRSLSEPIASLPRQIYDFAIGPYDDSHRQAWAGALILMMVALSINIGVRILVRGRTLPASQMTQIP
ncbi:MAG: phosphate ABC transporter permease PstA [Limisphaerales bacterium]